ncbi:hypothetical protein Mycch_4986 [Mycolicibacterium chubuense NBB4]|uniref:DUF4331 domain-containing protein n=1 Tax=Mycolicibacterium chubuense (strain NBB4) TaxID=710421 RepID=I4BQW6_MYCCN|nr:DUF4331 family protein [Mycolicibacterium chubuense]AFM19673.1 hypothetical protein Mycch_4986 [Mycolicibacterium chubuense NBB4]
MSTDFTGLRRGAPLGDPRLDLCDLYVFRSPKDPARTALILTANPHAEPLYPGAVYRIAIDNDGDLRNDIAFNFVFTEPSSGPDGHRQKVDVYLALQSEARVDAAAGSRIFGDMDVSFAGAPHVWQSGSFTFFAGARSDASFPNSNAMAMAVELPTSYLGAAPDVRVWGRVSMLRDGTWVHADRVGHPWISGFFTSDDDLAEFSAGEPNRDRERWMGHLIELLADTGGYTREEAITAIVTEGTLPDMLTYDPAKPATYPNGRTLTDDVADYRSRFLTNGHRTLTELGAPTDLLPEFPYLGAPH